MVDYPIVHTSVPGASSIAESFNQFRGFSSSLSLSIILCDRSGEIG